MPRPLLPLSGFRTFESAARHLSFARAAEELRVTPAAVSHQVRTLEDYLGVKLFLRAGKGLALTGAGAALLPDLRIAFDRMESALDRVRPRAEHGILTVALPPTFASKWLVPRLDSFRAANPDIELRLDVNDRIVGFEGSGVDVAVRYGLGQYDGLTVERLCDETVLPVCSPRLAERLRDGGGLATAELLHVDGNKRFDSAFPDWTDWLRAAQIEGVDGSRGMRFTLSGPAIEAAIDGQGVLLARSLLIVEDMAAGRLVRPFELELPVRPAYFLVYPKAALRQRNVGRLREWMLAEFARVYRASDRTDPGGFRELFALAAAD
ncbi:MAG: transcriptional regulator GcvA [Sphingomonadaceae bacterium]|nr:transcriptional regulator GcvA [Sphingomonadaceae bacterium]